MFRVNFSICLLLAGISTASAQSSQALIPLRIGQSKIASQAPSWVAQHKGMFKKHGLNVEVLSFRNGNEAVASLYAGSTDVTGSIPGSAFVAIERGFDMVAILQNGTASAKGPDVGSIQVRVDSPIKKLSDLKGKTLGINDMRSQMGVSVRLLVKRSGIDPSTVKFLELPPNSQLTALRNNRVDAVATSDPYSTQMQTMKIGRVIAWNYVETIPEQPLGVWFVKGTFLKKNPEAVNRFRAAMKEAIDYLNTDPVRARALVAEFIGMDPKLIATMPPTHWSYQVHLDKWQAVADMMKDSGQMERGHNAREYVAGPIKADIVH